MNVIKKRFLFVVVLLVCFFSTDLFAGRLRSKKINTNLEKQNKFLRKRLREEKKRNFFTQLCELQEEQKRDKQLWHEEKSALIKEMQKDFQTKQAKRVAEKEDEYQRMRVRLEEQIKKEKHLGSQTIRGLEKNWEAEKKKIRQKHINELHHALCRQAENHQKEKEVARMKYEQLTKSAQEAQSIEPNRLKVLLRGAQEKVELYEKRLKKLGS